MKTVKYFLKETWVVWAYTILTMVTAITITMIGAEEAERTGVNKLLWLQGILFVLNLGLYGMVVYMMLYKTGETAAKLKHSNDIKRRVIAETGDYYDFDRVSEYGKYKGLYIGLFASAPLILLLLIQGILDICGSESTAVTAIIGIAYGAFLLPIRSVISASASVYWSFYAVAINVILIAVAYRMGAYKIKKQNDRIKKTNAVIYGGGQRKMGEKPIEEVVRENAKYNKRRRNRKAKRR